MPEGGIESSETLATSRNRIGVPPIDLTKIFSICCRFSSAPLPRITNDMLPRGSTLPPPDAFVRLDRIDDVLKRQPKPVEVGGSED